MNGIPTIEKQPAQSTPTIELGGIRIENPVFSPSSVEAENIVPATHVNDSSMVNTTDEKISVTTTPAPKYEVSVGYPFLPGDDSNIGAEITSAYVHAEAPVD